MLTHQSSFGPHCEWAPQNKRGTPPLSWEPQKNMMWEIGLMKK